MAYPPLPLSLKGALLGETPRPHFSLPGGDLIGIAKIDLNQSQSYGKS
jgi:UDP-N-acetylglucosamine enolpyruvyl transferase